MIAVISSFAQQRDGSPADNLPRYIRRITHFGERADWSHDGRKILFIEKTYGDAYEVEIETGQIRLITGHFYHGGFTRALYLANGDVLLSGCTSFDAANPHVNRQVKAELFVLEKAYTSKPVSLGTKCSEGPAVSRKNMKIAWTITHRQDPDLNEGQYLFYMADIIYVNGIPELSGKTIILDNLKSKGIKGGMETQNFIPVDENMLTFTANGSVMLLDIATGKIINMSHNEKFDDEPEGIFPDGKYTLMERGIVPANMDIWKLKLDGSGEAKRLTYFNDYAGYRASNPSLSDNGRFMAFQMGKSTDLSGVGHGIFIMDIKKANLK